MRTRILTTLAGLATLCAVAGASDTKPMPKMDHNSAAEAPALSFHAEPEAVSTKLAVTKPKTIVAIRADKKAAKNSVFRRRAMGARS